MMRFYATARARKEGKDEKLQSRYAAVLAQG